MRPPDSDVRPPGNDVRLPGSDVRPPGSDVRPPGTDVCACVCVCRRAAFALLVVGVLTTVICTDAIVGAVQQEAAVVQLAQELVSGARGGGVGGGVQQEAAVVQLVRKPVKGLGEGGAHVHEGVCMRGEE